jgi:two-component system response regulator FixJ
VVDDDDESRISVSALVRSMGLRSESFGSAEEFLDNYQDGRPGCLVTDVRMRGMSGLALQEQLLQRNISLPVILLTTFARIPMTVQAMKRGAVTLLEKPCEEDQLWEAIRDALDLDADSRETFQIRKEYRRRLAALTPAERDVLAVAPLEGRIPPARRRLPPRVSAHR